MSFSDAQPRRAFTKSENKYRKTEFMQLPVGASTIRILEPKSTTRYTHFFKSTNASVLCLGEDCPVCKNNKSLINQFPDNFREQIGYNRSSERFFVNVLDKTMAKICECGKEYKNLVQTICQCGKVLSEAKPLNKVKVLSRGPTLRDDLDSIDKAIQDNQGTPLGLMNYDVILMVSDKGTTPVPQTNANQPVDLQGQELFDLAKVVIEVSPEEMLDVQRGVSLKDIFTARRAKEDKKYSDDFIAEPVASQEELEKVNDAVNALFQQ